MTVDDYLATTTERLSSVGFDQLDNPTEALHFLRRSAPTRFERLNFVDSTYTAVILHNADQATMSCDELSAASTAACESALQRHTNQRGGVRHRVGVFVVTALVSAGLNDRFRDCLDEYRPQNWGSPDFWRFGAEWVVVVRLDPAEVVMKPRRIVGRVHNPRIGRIATELLTP